MITHPIGVIVTGRPIIARGVAVLPITIAIINAWLDALVRAGEMEFTNETAIVALIRQ